MTHSFAGLSIGERLKIQQAVQQAATTQPAVTESVSIAFSYCLVKISRPWLAAYFLEDGPWYVPGAVKGSVSTRFNLLPLALLAIKDLVIAANWASKDISAAADAASFGPFKVSGGIVADKLTHPGIQVIGWLLQPLTALPPNDPPPA